MHLFTDLETGEDAVVYQSGRRGLRLARHRARDCGLQLRRVQHLRARGSSGHPSGDLLPCRAVTGACTITSSRTERNRVMKAKIGDWFVLKGRTVELSDRRGPITEVHGVNGAPPYVVRWLDTGHVATVVPGPDAIIVTAAEQEAADERANARLAAVQNSIAHQHPSK